MLSSDIVYINPFALGETYKSFKKIAVSIGISRQLFSSYVSFWSAILDNHFKFGI